MPSENLDLTTPDGTADAYLSRPDDGGEHPGVLLLMDAFGLRPQLEQMADRVAARGFVVLVPNLFYRAGPAPRKPMDALADPDDRASILEKIRPLMAELTPERIVSDGAAYLDALAQHSPGPNALVGYCMGGRVGWLIAAAHPARVAALGGFHAGGLVTDAPDSPHLATGSITAEVFLGHADNDASMTPEQIQTLEAALRDAGVTYRSDIFGGAAHGYTMADTPMYDHDAAERHFTELFALLDRALVKAG